MGSRATNDEVEYGNGIFRNGIPNQFEQSVFFNLADALRQQAKQPHWISVKERLPRSNGTFTTWDGDSLTNEKELLYEDGRFYYPNQYGGPRLDYTDTVTMWWGNSFD